RRDQMAGCYSSQTNGRSEMRIVKESQQYIAHVLINGAWDSTAMRRANSMELAPLFGNDTAKVVEALVAVSGPFGVFRVRGDAHDSNRDAEPQYLIFILFGTAPGFKVPCQAKRWRL